MRTRPKTRTVKGRVISDGSVNVGNMQGFTVRRNGVGNYTVLFNPPFAGIPAVVATPDIGAGSRTIRCDAPTDRQVTVLTATMADAAADISFGFQATGPVS